MAHKEGCSAKAIASDITRQYPTAKIQGEPQRFAAPSGYCNCNGEQRLLMTWFNDTVNDGWWLAMATGCKWATVDTCINSIHWSWWYPSSQPFAWPKSLVTSQRDHTSQCDGEPHHLWSSTISNKYGGYTNKHIIFGQSNHGFWMVPLNCSHKIRPTYSIKQLPWSLSKRPALTPWWSQLGPELWHFWQHNERETHMADTGWPWCFLVWPAFVYQICKISAAVFIWTIATCATHQRLQVLHEMEACRES